VHDPAVRDTVEVVVALLAALTVIAFAVRWVRLPLSVALVSFGLLVAAIAPVRFTISPDVVLIALLPGLVFEAAFRLHLADLQRVVGRTIVLAVPGVLLVAAVVAVVLHVATGLPLGSAFIVGAVVSATDPSPWSHRCAVPRLRDSWPRLSRPRACSMTGPGCCYLRSRSAASARASILLPSSRRSP